MDFNKTKFDILYDDMDRIIDGTIDKMDYGTKDNVSELITLVVNKINPNKNEVWRTGFIQDVLVEKGIIELLSGSANSGQLAKLTTRGVLIKKSGGWLSHLKEKRIKKNINSLIKWTTLILAFIGALAAINDGTLTRANTSDKYSGQSKEVLQCQDPIHSETKTDSAKLHTLDKSDTSTKK